MFNKSEKDRLVCLNIGMYLHNKIKYWAVTTTKNLNLKLNSKYMYNYIAIRSANL